MKAQTVLAIGALCLAASSTVAHAQRPLWHRGNDISQKWAAGEWSFHSGGRQTHGGHYYQPRPIPRRRSNCDRPLWHGGNDLSRSWAAGRWSRRGC